MSPLASARIVEFPEDREDRQVRQRREGGPFYGLGESLIVQSRAHRCMKSSGDPAVGERSEEGRSPVLVDVATHAETGRGETRHETGGHIQGRDP